MTVPSLLPDRGWATADPHEASAPTVNAGTLAIPGQPWPLGWRRDADGRLVELRCGARTHLVERDGARYFGDELAIVSELHDGTRLVRVVHAHGETWIEEYRVDALGRLAHVDGIDVVRDPAGRVTRAGAWSYGYDGDALVTVDGPFGRRAIEYDATGRANAVRDSLGYRAFSYDLAGRRIDVAALPAGTHHRDEHGRLWTITDDRGAVVATFLWEGLWCLGRIDGDARAPLAAVFSLDPTGTPVRIIDADSVRRVPRDAFGEGLLAEHHVPGLFGAAIHDGLHYLPARTIDARTGRFCSPDPWNGGPADPRRVERRDGPLFVELPGRYIVCRNDPIGRTDPTGCISASAALVAFSSLTWASSTTVFGLLGFDLSINFWLSLFTGNIGDWVTSFGDGMAARRHGGFGVRRGGLLGFERAYTIGHYVMHDALTYAGYDLIAAFVPSAAMPLGGYGTLLQLAPTKGSGPFLLDGSRGIKNATAARGWTRGGGVGDPLYPGATVAKYDSGALHIDRTQTTAGSKTVLVKDFNVASTHVSGPQACTLTELAPTGGWAAGISLSNLTAVTLAGTALGIGIGNLELLTHATIDATGATVIDAAVIATVLNVVEQNGKTEVTLETSGAGLPTPFRLRALGPAPAAETASAVAGQPGYLSTAATAAPYAAGDPLRLSQTSGAAGLVPVGAAVISRLEAQLTLDEGPPANATGVSLTLVTAGAVGGPAVVVSGEAKMTCSGAVPPIPSVIVITVGAATLPVGATAIADNPAGGKDVTLDRNNTFSGNGSWSPLVPGGASFGSAQTVAAGAGVTVTYLPAAPRTTPAVGSVLRLDVSNTNPTARVVTAVNYDALVLTSLPGNVALQYSVERFPFLTVDQSNLGLAQKQGLNIDPTLTPPANQTLNGLALRLNELAGPTLAAAAAGVASTLPALTLTVESASLTTPLTAAAAGDNPNPGQLMLLSDGAATLELTVVTGIQLTVNCDRPWTGAAAKLEAFPIVDGGVAYPAISVGAAGTLVMTLGNTLTVAGNPLIVELPRFAVGEIVRLRWTDGAASPNEIFRVSDVEALKSGTVPLVDSTTITLVGGRLTPSAIATAFTVTRQVPATPAANIGSAREGIFGTVGPVAAGGNSPMTFNVWQVGALAAVDYAISDGTTALPMRFLAPTAALPGKLVIQLGAAPLSFANGTQPTLRIPTLAAPVSPPGVSPSFSATVYAASFTQTGNVVNFTVHPDEPSVLAPATGNIIVAVPFGQNLAAATNVTPPTAPATSGTLSPGSVLIPEDTSFELTLKEGLIEHETRHTMQYSWFGPLMWGFFPLVPLLEKVYPGLDKSEFSPSFDGELIKGPGESTIRLTNFGATTLKSGDAISGGLNVPVVLGRVNSTITEAEGSLSFFIADEDFSKLRQVGDNAGKLQVRKITKPSKGLAFLLKSAPAFLTPGGVTEFAVANTWGWFVYGIVRVIYALKARSNFGGLTYTAKVSADGTSLTMEDVTGTDAMIDVSRVLVKHKDSTVIRTVTVGATDDVLVLTEPLTSLKDTEVEVAPYDTHQPASNWDWNRYYPAKLAAANKPVTIVVEPANAEGTNKLVLKLQDEVLLRTGSVSKKSVVTAVNADGSYDLKDPPLLALGGQNAGLDQEFRIAKVGEHDPVGSLGALTANFIHAPWLGKVSDPWAWLLSLPDTNPKSAGDWTLRVLRWLASSHSFSMIVPGWLWVDDLFRGDGSFAAWMEQDASENSGDLYTSLGRFEGAPSRVGDIGRYWFFPNGRYLSNYPGGGFDRAGARIRREVVVAPLVTDETGGTSINKNAGSKTPDSVPPAAGAPLPPGAGDVVPDALYSKNTPDPRQPAGLPPSFVPNDRGIIPLAGAVERTNGAYVAFTRSGKHRATIIEGYHSGAVPQFPNEIKDARSVVDSGAGPFGLFKTVTLFFDRTVADLDVKIAGIPLANDDNVTLVLTQTAAVSVTPADPNRRYALTLQRPMNGPLLQADQVGADPNTIQVQAPAALPVTPVEPVELCRVYRFDAATQSFDDPALNRFKMSLSGDLRIPVRRFTVTVTATITARSKVSISAADDIAAMVPGGDAFVLVPAAVTLPLAIAISYNPAAPPGTKDPAVTADREDIPAALVQDGVAGTAFKINCNRADPPEQTATLTLSASVGFGALAATLTGTLLLNPAFVLDAPGANFQVARGATIVLTAHDLASPPADVNVSAVDPLAGITITVNNATITLAVDLAATPGTLRVIATLAADATGDTKAARTITIV